MKRLEKGRHNTSLKLRNSSSLHIQSVVERQSPLQIDFCSDIQPKEEWEYMRKAFAKNWNSFWLRKFSLNIRNTKGSPVKCYESNQYRNLQSPSILLNSKQIMNEYIKEKGRIKRQLIEKKITNR